VKCEVVAPSLVPVKAGDRVKTDRLDASKLARSYRAGELTAVWVPDEAHEALRDLVRAREAAKHDQLRARHRLSKFLLRHGRRAPSGIKVWTQKYHEWIKEQVHFEQPAQQYTLLDYLHEIEHVAGRIGTGARRGCEAGTATDAGGDPSPAGTAPSRPDLGGSDSGRIGRDLTFRAGPPTDGL